MVPDHLGRDVFTRVIYAARVDLQIGAIGVAKADRERAVQVADAVRRTTERFGRIDVLVNNAGITQPVKTLEITGADYDRILDVSLRGTLYMSQAVLPTMKAQLTKAIMLTSTKPRRMVRSWRSKPVV